VRTAGIDLAAQDARTAGCVVDWRDGRARVVTLVVGMSDDDLRDLIRSVNKAGIDAPFGWPEEFVEAVSSWSRLREWPAWSRRRLRYRETDMRVEGGRPPLSVSSDLIAVVAMRCASLLTKLAGDGEVIDRAGARRVAEVYPAATLRAWGLVPGAYKRTAGQQRRRELLDDLLDRGRGWLTLSAGDREACEHSDDAFDALVCALTARAVALHLTVAPRTAGDRTRARHEGWIHVPEADSLPKLPLG
jgi:predicted nuclease with RNAse H fold